MGPDGSITVPSTDLNQAILRPWRPFKGLSSRSSWWAEGITSMGGEANLSRLRDAEKHENGEMCSWASSLPPSCTSSGCHNTNNPSNFPQALVRWRRTPCGVVVAAFLDHAGESYRVCFASQVWRSSGQPRAQSDQ